MNGNRADLILRLAFVVSICVVEAIELQEQKYRNAVLCALLDTVCDAVEAGVWHVVEAHLPAAVLVRRESPRHRGSCAGTSQQAVRDRKGAEALRNQASGGHRLLAPNFCFVNKWLRRRSGVSRGSISNMFYKVDIDD